MTSPIKFLHTSDWHLGRTLCGRRRGAEFARFLDWLAEVIENEAVEVLLVAGDIFDGLNPSPAAQELYYGFLGRMAKSSGLKHVVIIAGNHDSPAQLEAPAAILKALDIHVVGRLKADGRSEVFALKDSAGAVRLIAAAVPYPRDRDLRESAAGESPEDKERKLVEAIAAHYEQAGRLAEEMRAEAGGRPPIIGLGHLFAAGGQTVEGDGVRSLYVGSLGLVPAAAFPNCFDYLALGHLHQAQVVGGDERRRYSGSPLAHSFAEAGRDKIVVLGEISESGLRIESREVPVFQRLERVRGDWDEIRAALGALIEENISAWLEIEYDGQEIIGDLSRRVEEILAGTALEVLRLKNNRAAALALESHGGDESLEDLDETEVFRRCLMARQAPEEQWPALLACYEELLKSMREEP